MTTDLPEPAAKVFVSYAHADDKLFGGGITNFCSDLKGFFRAETGRNLNVFLDHESIGWGTNWRSEIENELLNSLIFMPIVSMQYFMRPSCRDEINAFHSNAKRLETPYLILPIVIAGTESVTGSDPRPEVQIIQELQFKNLEDAFTLGRGSSEWRLAVREIAKALAGIVAKAETEAAARIKAIEPKVVRTGELEGTDGLDLFEYMETVEALTTQVQAEARQSISDLERWGKTFTGTLPPAEQNHANMRLYCIRLADAIRDPSANVYSSGTKFASTASDFDANIRGMFDELSGLSAKQLHGLLGVHSLAQSTSEGEFPRIVEQMTEWLEMMQIMEIASAPLRKSLKPARLGIERIRDALRVLAGLTALLPDDPDSSNAPAPADE